MAMAMAASAPCLLPRVTTVVAQVYDSASQADEPTRLGAPLAARQFFKLIHGVIGPRSAHMGLGRPQNVESAIVLTRE
jgi:hypothetical protein